MKGIFVTLFISLRLLSQQPSTYDDPNSVTLEDLAESYEEFEEDDNVLQQLEYYRHHPLSLNSSEDELKNFPLLTPQLVANLIAHRNTFGDLVSIYELKAVPGFTAEINRKLQGFVTVTAKMVEMGNLVSRFSGGKHTMLVRPSRARQIIDGPPHAGNAMYLLVRYKYQFRNLLQFGITGEKDAGEPMFPQTFPLTDFSSFHLFARDAGPFKTIALGDYTVNLGQGLIHWQSQAFKKSSSVLQVKRQSETLKPYQSVGEHNYYRGIAASIRLPKIEISSFISSRKLSANLGVNESNQQVITSFITSGLHRTTSEIADRHAARVHTAGASLKHLLRTGHFGLNMIGHAFSHPLQKIKQPYNHFAIAGKKWLNGSFDYSITHRNYHLFGEIASDWNGHFALISGVIGSLNADVDIACVYRNISKAYQSLSGNAFTESSFPTNEKGFYTGISLKIPASFKLDLYADLYSYPWLKYRVDAPSTGAQYLVQLLWNPTKMVEVYTRYRRRMKPINSPDEEEIDFPDHNHIANWRTHISFRVNKELQLRNRVEVNSFNTVGSHWPERGFLTYTDIIYVPLLRWFSGNARIMYFETESYDTRIYTYENDLLFVGHVPSYTGTGFRTYMNFKGNFSIRQLRRARLTVSFKVAYTALTGTLIPGSPESATGPGNRLDIKCQAFITPFA